MRKLIGSALLLSSSLISTLSYGENPKHAKIEAVSSVKDKNVELDFKVVMPNAKADGSPVKEGEGLVVSKEGGWRLELTNVNGLKLETKEGKFTTREFDPNKPGFVVKAPLDGSASAGKVDYMMKVFVCKADKTQCFFETHKGTLDWKKT